MESKEAVSVTLSREGWEAVHAILLTEALNLDREHARYVMDELATPIGARLDTRDAREREMETRDVLEMEQAA